MNFSKHLTIALKEMCRRVGVTFDDVDFTADNWFQQYKWTEEEQEEFQEWFVNYLYNNKEAREEITTIGIRNKKRLRAAVLYFLLDWGWSLVERTMVSACHGAGVKIKGKGMTRWHVCASCGEPCDIKEIQRLDTGGKK